MKALQHWTKTLAVSTLLAGCSSLPGAKTDATDTPLAPESTQPTDTQFLLSPIADPQIPKGKCGMILWTLDAERPSPVFRFVSGEQANIAFNKAPQPLTLSEASGAAGFGVYENLEFEAPGNVKVKVTVRFGQGFDGGAYLQRGLIVMEHPQGWRSVTPSAGIAGCRS